MAAKVICVVGPTASGKTGLGVLLAKALRRRGGLRGLHADLPGDDHRHRRPHAGGDGRASPTTWSAVADPAESVVRGPLRPGGHRLRWRTSCARGKRPVLVGGTGLWLDALDPGAVTFAPGQAGGEVRRDAAAAAGAEGIGPLLRGAGAGGPGVRRHSSTRRTKSGSSGPWRSTWRRGRPSPPTTPGRRPCLPGTTRCGSACSSTTGRT